MGGDSPKENAVARSACTECQRRKQKCNREWPCNHCQKRKVADKCRFSTVLDEKPAPEPVRRRQVVAPPPPPPAESSSEEDSEPSDDDFDEAGLEALGYSAAHFMSALKPKEERKPSAKASQQQYFKTPASCSQLEHALRLLPPRPYLDALVQNFLNVVNFQYYIVYPQTFLKEYQQWWVDKFENRPLGLPWTSLLLMICACSAQYPDPQLKEKLERDLGQPTQRLSEKYHTAGRELYHTIPVGNSHMYTVQALLHSCSWFKSEARFVECWHALTATVREAQELGIHQESIVQAASEFDLEMRRRAWCLLSVWDWQIGTLLSRPLILDPSECDVHLPSLSLEEYSPSPILFVKLQAEIIWKLSARFGRPGNVVAPHAIEEYKNTIENWIQRLPMCFTFDHPDRSLDNVFPWMVLHRHTIQTLGLSMILDPIRPYLAKPMSKATTHVVELRLRQDGVGYALRLMGELHGFFDFVYPGNAQFHTVLFSIFDTAALICSAILHDEDQSLPRRDECLKSIEGALGMLSRLQSVNPSAQKPYEMLTRLAKRVSKQLTSPKDGRNRKRARVAATPMSHNNHSPPAALPRSHSEMVNTMPLSAHPSEPWQGYMPPSMVQSTSPQYQVSDSGSMHVPSPPGGISGTDGSFILSTSPSNTLSGTPVTTASAYTGGMVTADDSYQDFSMGTITDADLGQLAGLWNYQSLNLDHVNPYSGP